MLAIPFGRIFWKEYRVHRALWLSCLMIGCVIQLFFWWNIVLAPNQTAELFEVFVVLVPLMYAIGCGALLFAGEREERTCEWLVALAAPPAQTLYAKLAFGVCSTLALQLAMEILSRLVLANTTHHGEPNRFVYPLPYGLLILPWAVLGSLRSRQVMSSFLVMLFYVFVTSMCTPIVMFGFVFVFQNDSTILIPICGCLTVFLVLLAADIWFGWRWCQGHYFDSGSFTTVFARDQRLTSVAGNTNELSRIPARIEYEQPWRRTWQRLVWQEQHRASMTGILVAGCLAASLIGSLRFIPDEIRSHPNRINYLLLLGLISIVSFGVGLFGFRSDSQFQQTRFLNSRGISPASIWLSKHFVWFPRACWLTAFMSVTSLIVNSFGDYQGTVFLLMLLPVLFVLGLRFVSKLQMPRFVTNQINSLSSSWLMKQTSLTSRAFWILGIVYFLSNWFDWLSKGQSDPGSWRLHAMAALAMIVLGIRFDSNLTLPGFVAGDQTSRTWSQFTKFSGWLPILLWGVGITWIALIAVMDLESTLGISDHVSTRFSKEIQFPWDILFWCIMLSYCCGQLAAILFQRVTLSLVIGLAMTGGSLFWLGLVHFLAVPKWWAVGLPVMAMLVLTLWQTKPWLHENRSWSRRWRVACALTALPVVLVVLLAFYRVAQANLPFGISGVEDIFVSTLQTQERNANRSNPDDEPIRLRLETLSRQEKEQTDFQSVADEIVGLLNNDSFVFHKAYPREGNASHTVTQLKTILNEQADAYLRNGLSDKALACHLADLKLARSASRGPYYTWLEASNLQAVTLEQLVQWSNHPSQTPGSIRAAIRSIETEIARFPSATEAIVESYRLDRQTWILSQRADVIEELSRMRPRNRDSFALEMIPVLLPWERVRADLVMSHDARIRFAAIWSLEQQLNSPIRVAKQSVIPRLSFLETMVNEWARTTPLAEFSKLPLEAAVGSVLRHHTMIRAGITRMELIAYRMEHGTLPKRLIQLMESLDGKYLIDPWSDRLFDYYPSFLLSVGSSHSALVPVSSKEVEIQQDSTPNSSGRVNFNEALSESGQALTLNRDGVTSSCLFRIPPPTIQNP